MTSTGTSGGPQAAWTVVFGPGPRLASIEALARAASAQVDPGIAVSIERLQDLAQLLAPRGREGRLVLDGDHLLLEDLGFVRRFLASASAWGLLLLGEDAGRRAARAALALDRTRWLPWPPDLAQLEEIVSAPAHLRPPGAPASAAASDTFAAAVHVPDLALRLSEIADLAERAQQAAGGPEGAPPEGEGPSDLVRLARLARSIAYVVAPPRPPATTVDAGPLVEDLLAALALRGKKAPRFLYRGARGVHVHAERDSLTRALESLLLLARGCAGPGEMVRVQLGPRPETPGEAQLLVDFPAGPLAAVGQPGVLAGARFEPVGGIAPGDLAAAQAVLRALGARLELSFPQAGAAQLRVGLPAEIEEPRPEAGSPAAAAAGAAVREAAG